MAFPVHNRPQDAPGRILRRAESPARGNIPSTERLTPAIAPAHRATALKFVRKCPSGRSNRHKVAEFGAGDAANRQADPLPRLRPLLYDARTKGEPMRRRSRSLQSRNRVLLSMFGPPVLLFLLIVGGIYFYDHKYGEPASAYDQAIADCVRDRTRVATTSDAQEQATSDCVRETPSGQ